MNRRNKRVANVWHNFTGARFLVNFVRRYFYPRFPFRPFSYVHPMGLDVIILQFFILSFFFQKISVYKYKLITIFKLNILSINVSWIECTFLIRIFPRCNIYLSLVIKKFHYTSIIKIYYWFSLIISTSSKTKII